MRGRSTPYRQQLSSGSHTSTAGARPTPSRAHSDTYIARSSGDRPRTRRLRTFWRNAAFVHTAYAPAAHAPASQTHSATCPPDTRMRRTACAEPACAAAPGSAVLTSRAAGALCAVGRVCAAVAFPCGSRAGTGTPICTGSSSLSATTSHSAYCTPGRSSLRRRASSSSGISSAAPMLARNSPASIALTPFRGASPRRACGRAPRSPARPARRRRPGWRPAAARCRRRGGPPAPSSAPAARPLAGSADGSA